MVDIPQRCKFENFWAGAAAGGQDMFSPRITAPSHDALKRGLSPFPSWIKAPS
jgi:hypothetical protein